jgi:GAF domain-containing protein
MNFAARLDPSNIPPSFAGKSDLLILRERILQMILLIFAFLGLPAVTLASADYLQQQSYLFPAVYFGVYLLFVLMLLYREIPYRVRGYTMVSVVYMLAVSELFESGQLGEVRMFLIAFVTLTAVLFSYRNVIAAIALGLLTIMSAGFYASVTPQPIGAMAGLNTGTGWATSSAVFLMIATTIAGSIAMIISGLEKNLLRQAVLTRSLEQERMNLEDRIRERTEDMTRRIVQLRTAADISRTISELSSPDELLQQVADIVKERFRLYYVGVFLLDTRREFAVLKAGTGQAGKQMVASGHQLPVRGNSMIGWSISNRLPRVAMDTGSEAVRFNNPLLPLTRSELALPIIVHDEILGAISVQSEKSNAFDENDIAILQSIADSLAVARENDRLYNETRRSLEEIRALNREYLQRAWAETSESYGELTYTFENATLAGKDQPGKTVQVPLVVRDEVIGYIELEMDHELLSEDDLSFVENVTTQTAIALENARLLHETERRAIQERKLNELASRFSKALSIEEILRAAALEFGQLPTVTEVSIQVRPTETKKNTEHVRSAGGNGKERAA